jgi:uncharacterized protein
MPSQVRHLPFQPFLGFTSPHLQTIIACLTPSGASPPSTQLLVPLPDGDKLCCEMSAPPAWKPQHKTVVLIHGLCGDHNSSYMVRLSRKFYSSGLRVLRVNMRSTGSGRTLSQHPYHGGKSDDIWEILNVLKEQTPDSPIVLIGFSLGGNIALKLAGELGEKASSYLERTIAVCSPVDLSHAVDSLALPANRLYNLYYIYMLNRQGKRWTNGKSFSTVREFDSIVTAPQWGFNSVIDYYKKCSSLSVLPSIAHPCHMIFAVDDPFVDYSICLTVPLPPCVKVWLTKHGGHMGFFGWAGEEHKYFWLDSVLIKCATGDGILN